MSKFTCNFVTTKGKKCSRKVAEEGDRCHQHNFKCGDEDFQDKFFLYIGCNSVKKVNFLFENFSKNELILFLEDEHVKENLEDQWLEDSTKSIIYLLSTYSEKYLINFYCNVVDEYKDEVPEESKKQLLSFLKKKDKENGTNFLKKVKQILKKEEKTDAKLREIKK